MENNSINPKGKRFRAFLRSITPVIIRKKLITTQSQQEMARVKDILDRNEFVYTLKTLSNMGAISRGMNAASYARAYIAYNDTSRFAYVIYVRKKDYDRAYRLCFKGKGVNTQ